MRPLSTLDVIKEITGTSKVNPVGYCIGGTLLSMLIPYLTVKGDETINSATFFVALQDFKLLLVCLNDLKMLGPLLFFFLWGKNELVQFVKDILESRFG